MPAEPLPPEDAEELEEPLRERLGPGGGPGALWHIFRAEDAERIRDFLRQVGAATPGPAPAPGSAHPRHPQESQEPGQPGGSKAEPPGPYLDPELRRRLRDECGVSGWSLLQLPGDAVLVPAGAPHQVGGPQPLPELRGSRGTATADATAAGQVRSLTGTISVEQRFLSPESAVRLRQLGSDIPGSPRHLRAQVRRLGKLWGQFGGAGVGGAVLSPLSAPSQLDGMILAAVREALGVLGGCR